MTIPYKKEREKRESPFSPSFLPFPSSPFSGIPEGSLDVAMGLVGNVLEAMTARGVRVLISELRELADAALEEMVPEDPRWESTLRCVEQIEEDWFSFGDGRVHPEWELEGTFTGRILARHPYIQQLTKKYRLRSAVVPAKGSLFVVADWSHAQFRVAAGLSRDPQLNEDLSSGRDLYVELGKLTGVDADPIKLRTLGKAVAMPMLFRGTPTRMVGNARKRDVNLPHAKAKQFSRAWRARYPGLEAWLRKVEVQHVTTSPLGRTINTAFSRKNAWEATAICAPVQSGEADALRLVLLEVYQTL